MVSAAITTAFEQENAKATHQHRRSVADPMRAKVKVPNNTATPTSISAIPRYIGFRAKR
jgi:hypothetical protein